MSLIISNMGLLPDIIDGVIVPEKRIKVYRDSTVAYPQKGRPKNTAIPSDPEKNLEELNNEGHNLVSEDFEDSPFADRTPLTHDQTDI